MPVNFARDACFKATPGAWLDWFDLVSHGPSFSAGTLPDPLQRTHLMGGLLPVIS
jgi:hypothetical protein